MGVFPQAQGHQMEIHPEEVLREVLQVQDLLAPPVPRQVLVLRVLPKVPGAQVLQALPKVPEAPALPVPQGARSIHVMKILPNHRHQPAALPVSTFGLRIIIHLVIRLLVMVAAAMDIAPRLAVPMLPTIGISVGHILLQVARVLRDLPVARGLPCIMQPALSHPAALRVSLVPVGALDHGEAQDPINIPVQ
ncbi:MAG: hypothetical protein Greene101449_643 [Candidatus Peregrinibacteria bacterium Greene1014_49]|nr:MAG: hypothetical protein Greene101449_643 [Candidatus Peregrinibacteria bacterium Greene1014_49]